MKISIFSEPQILGILRQAEGGVPVPVLSREHKMSNASFYKWRAKYGGMDASMISKMKALEDENRRLKKMYAEMSMQTELLKEALGKNDAVISTPRDGQESRGATRGQHCTGLPYLCVSETCYRYSVSGVSLTPWRYNSMAIVGRSGSAYGH